MEENEVIPLTVAEIAALAAAEAALADAPPLVPAFITPLQARNGLRAWGIGRTEINAFFDEIEDMLAREAAQDAWEYATQIDRSDPLVAACAAFLGKTEAELDQFFIDAVA
jgi:hypothetical protein